MAQGANPGISSHLDLEDLDQGDPHPQAPFLAGRIGGQNWYGGSSSRESLTVQPTSDALQGYLNLNGTTIIDSSLSFGGVLSPSQITSDQNDYSPTGGFECSIWRLNTDANRYITGILLDTFDGPVNIPGFMLIIVNNGSSAASSTPSTTEITVADRLTIRLLANHSQNGVSADSSL